MKKLLFILFFFPIIGFTQISQNVDSLLQVLETSDDTLRIDVLTTLAFLHNDTAFDKTIEYASLANNLSVELGDKPREALALKFIGFGFLNKCDYSRALQYFEKSLTIQESLKNKSEIIILLNVIGTSTKEMGDYKTGIEFLIRAARQQTEVNDTLGSAMSYSNIGNIYLEMNDYPKALEFYTKCYNIVLQLGHQYGIGLTLMNMGMVQKNLKEYEKSSGSYEAAIEIFSNIQALYPLAATYGNYSELLSNQGNYSEALKLLDKSTSLLEQLNDESQTVEALLMYGRIYTKMGEYKTAIEYFEKSVLFAKKNNQKTKLKDAYEGLATAWTALYNFKKALTFTTLFHQLKDSLVNIETSKQISEIQTKYETEKKEKENTILKKENEIATMQLNDKNKTIFNLILAVALFAVFIGIILIQYNKKQKAYRHLVRQNLLLVNAEVEFSLRDDIPKPKTEVLQSDENTNNNESDLIGKIETLMLEEKPFLFSGITLDEICLKLSTNRTYLSHIINSHYEKNFNEFINDYRIKVARQLLADPEKNHFSIEGIGQMAGFNSSSTFFSYFKKATGITPSYFRNSVKDIKHATN